ncbi:60S ribosomal protein L13 [Boothiomyces macroporosus]|uniref:60S ribosomal protein L13 n=1 Tax=Boothiomyces macroporosus TaxID=261099 RepID=A0AAD5UJC7_9FUNG|nr:60S ribosomal protein L13 [Boothiomyces macroporosus]KAJ3313736.1 60S ribosomal protein L13 [Boothiomyces sp. JEL0838]
MKHNNVLPNQHFRKDWQLHVRTWFDQPGKKKSRRTTRLQKAAKIAPRPIDGLLRPAVRCPTLKYNTKLRAGRGFTIEELKEAGIRRKEALTIGIAVDHRRKNRSVESVKQNVARLAEYKAKLIVFPKKKADVSEAVQLKGALFPVQQPVNEDVERKISSVAQIEAYATLRKARSDKRLKGTRDARAKAKAEEEANKKK